jgi:hypothetical protein
MSHNSLLNIKNPKTSFGIFYTNKNSVSTI